MDSNGDSHAIVPFRHRHDGWTPERQDRFLERLRGTGCVTEACRAAGLSTTSAYRAFHRMPGFAAGWQQALAARKPMLEDAAFERAVRGQLQPLTRLGKVIGQRRQYSDSLLRFLIEREDRRELRAAQAVAPTRGGARGAPIVKAATREETTEVILKKLEFVEKRLKAEERAKELAFAERMRREGKAP